MSVDERQPGQDGVADEPPQTALAPVAPSDPIPDPGLGPHQPRPTDVDLSLEKRAERQVAGLFGTAAVLLILFGIAYLMVSRHAVVFGFSASNLSLGLCLGLAMMCIGVGAVQWAKKLMADEEIVEERHPARSSDQDREEAIAAFTRGVRESGFGRRTLIRNSLLGAMGLLGLPAVIMLGDLGPLPGRLPSITVWKRGIRVVNDISGTPIRPADLQVGQLVNAEPAVFFEQRLPNGKVIPPQYTGAALLDAKAKAAVILVRMLPKAIHPLPSRKNWGVDGILCYSKICTHAGCPISLWEQQTHQLLCPCHQSTFDLANNGTVVFGPAARSLPQLPIMVDSEGYLIAASPFPQPVGPSFWERG